MRALIPRVAVLAFLAVSSAGRAQPIWPEGAALTARPVSGGGTISTTFALRWPAAEGAAHYEILAGDAPVARLGADVRRHALVTPDLSHVAIRPVDAQGRAGKALTAVETRAVLKVLGAGSGRPVANLLGAGADPRGV
ncbi:MAG: hypothetical protein KC613_11165, partial [Myxococcales bacterium]|nr:hypothetical protein [Myxococcales bacterium]